ncbi:AAA family ATPase [Nonomuraea sp. NPDC049400]|uniref:helix-turn-helix transcriptional regulator n=1 Tax=Nonomuraea sp. NPDC049400 TaxID=3364352 RepID=UPI00379DDDDC
MGWRGRRRECSCSSAGRRSWPCCAPSWRAACEGPARRVVVEGPEGIGKTALIHRVLRGDAGVRVLAAGGEESERRLRLGVLRQLTDEAAVLGLRAGLEPAVAGRPPAVAGEDPCVAGQVVCDVIEALQARGPLVVLVDDAQWADGASLRALGYVLRRVRAGRVLALVACRDLAGPWLPEGLRRLLTGDETLRITLSGLNAADLAELAAHLPEHACDRALGGPGAAFGSRSGANDTVDTAAADVLSGAPGARGLAEPAAARLRDHTLGNPLHARALLATVPERVLADRGVRLPAPGTYALPFARRLHACTPAAGRLVAACAVLDGSCPLHVAAAVAGGLDGPLEALEEAVNAGLLRELPGRLVGFLEPLARAAAYDGLGAGVRARLHLAAARVVDDIGTALRHRAAAAGGPDEALAEELASFAAKAAQHGQWHEAAAHLDLAAGLTESAARRDELRTAALEHVLIGGDVLRAAELATTRNADPRPVRQYVLGRLALASGRFEAAAGLLAEAWRHREPGFAADVAEQLAWLHLVTGDRDAAASWARLAIDQPIEGTVGRPYDVLALGGAPGAGPHSGYGAGPQPGPGVDPGSGPRASAQSGPGAPPDSLAAAVRLLAQGVPDEACTVLRKVVSGTATAGLPHHRLLASGLLAVAEHETARWDAAAARAEGALAEAAALGQAWLLPCLEVACVAPLAARGEHERALAHAIAARATARRLRHAMGERQADLALALLGAEPTSSGAGDIFPSDARQRRTSGAPAKQPRRTSGAAGNEQGRADEAARPDRGRVGEAARPGRGRAAGEGAGTGRGQPLDVAEREARPVGDVDGRDPWSGWAGDVFVPDPRPGRVEALVADGRLEEAERALAAYEEAGPGLRGQAEQLRLHGLLLAARNVPTEAEETFGRALALVEGEWPLEEARMLLDLGRLLRRTGRRRVAAERLGAARAIFEQLGARPLADRCVQELEACGLEPPATVRLGLTPQELSTATLVAGGLTNRQIARELLISVKTVEYHIGKIYAKLGIGSRVALAAKLASYGPAS